MTWDLVELMGNSGRSAGSHSDVFSYLVTIGYYLVIYYNVSYTYWVKKKPSDEGTVKGRVTNNVDMVLSSVHPRLLNLSNDGSL